MKLYLLIALLCCLIVAAFGLPEPSADPEFDGGYGTDLPIYDDDGSFPEGEGEPEGEW